MLRIGINLLPYSIGSQGGAEVYIRNLLMALAEVDCEHEFVLFVTPQSKDKYRPDHKQFSEVVLPKWADINRATRILIEQTILPYAVRRSNVDCLFSNYVIPLPAALPQIVNVHDMLYKQRPELIEPAKRVYWKLAIPFSLKKSAAVMTVSHSSAQDIRTFFPYVDSKLFVTVEGVNQGLVIHKDVDPDLARKELGIRAPFMLSAATFAPHKNMKTLISAFAEVHQALPDIRLVLTGRANTKDAAREYNELTVMIQSLKLEDHVIFPGYVSEQVLASLYRSAEAYVNPSSYEGFGLSVIEAQHFGTPVICSNIPALTEVGGDAVITADPAAPQDFAQKMIDLLSNPEARSRLTELGYQNLSRYTWHQAALDVIHLCENVVQGDISKQHDLLSIAQPQPKSIIHKSVNKNAIKQMV